MMSMQRSLLFRGGLCVLATLASVSVRADEKADALLKEVEKASKAAKTLSATATTSMTFQGQNIQQVGTVRLKQPNLARVDMTKPQAMTTASDGKNVFMLIPGNQYMKMPAKTGLGILAGTSLPAGLFLDVHAAVMDKATQPKTRYAGSQTIDKTKYDIVELSVTTPIAATIKIFINPGKLVTRTEMDINQQGQTIKQTSILSNVKTGQPYTDASFAYTPPKGAKLLSQPTGMMPNKR
jgi:outer membrane lipoprotein-sorting protein